jgi:nicotinamide-nucleotide amidase
MPSLLPLSEAIGELLKARKETVAVAESSTGGLIAASLLAVPGASAYFVGGAVLYTHKAREALLGIELADHPGMRASTEPYALLCANTMRERLGATWGIGESGATGPSGNRYGDAAGHSCIAICGPEIRSITLETGSAEREANMWRFAREALALFEAVLRG